MATIKIRFNSNNCFGEVLVIDRQVDSPVYREDVSGAFDTIASKITVKEGDGGLLEGATEILVEIEVEDGEDGYKETATMEREFGESDDEWFWYFTS